MIESTKINRYVGVQGAIVYKNDKGGFHREHGPAFISYRGDIVYFKDDEFHRDDGPAIIYSNGFIDHWVVGERIRRSKL